MRHVPYDIRREPWPDESLLEPPEEYAAGARIFRAGQTIRTVWLIADGVVKITIPSGPGEALVAVRTAGWMLAATPALVGVTQPATATALTRCELRALPLGRLRELLVSDGRVATWLTQMLAVDALEQHGRTVALCSGRSEAYLEWLVVQLFRASHVSRADGALRMGFYLSVTDMGSLIGVSRQWVTRLLADMATRGLIERKGDWLVLPQGSPLIRQVRGGGST